MPRRTTVGFLHTAEEHVATFARLLGRIAPPLRGAHVVDVDLLDDARARGGDDPDVRARLGARLDELDDRGAGVIVCTCSTLGPFAERGRSGVAGDGTPPVLRVDRPAAEQAASLARWRPDTRGRIGLVATLATAAAATRPLLADEPDLTVLDALVPDGWLAVAAGERERAVRVVADAARELAGRVDVVLLAQVGLAGAAERLTDLRVPVLTTPRPAVIAAVDTLTRP